MRIRYKPWARQELEESKFYIDDPENYIGRWKELFENKNNPLHVELGCGKGGFISDISVNNSNINYIGIDLVDAMLGLAKRKIEDLFKEKNREINNVILTRYDIERILNIFNKEDNIERIYINFCNPWSRGKHHKKRLTHIRQLTKYKEFLNEDGQIYFKTDDDSLFSDTLNYLKEANFIIENCTYDLDKEKDFWDNIETEHEKMFKNEGIKIKALIARKND